AEDDIRDKLVLEFRRVLFRSEGEDAGGAEQHGRVLPNLPCLDVAEKTAAFFGGEAGAVDDAVDDLLVDHVVDEACYGSRDEGGEIGRASCREGVEGALTGGRA